MLSEWFDLVEYVLSIWYSEGVRHFFFLSVLLFLLIAWVLDPWFDETIVS